MTKSKEAEIHIAGSKDLKLRLVWLDSRVEANLEQQLHNPKPEEDDKPWNVWYLHSRQDLWLRQAQVSMSLRTVAASRAHPCLPPLKTGLKCESSSPLLEACHLG